MSTSLEKLVVSLEAESAKYQRELSKAQKQLSSFEKQAAASAARVSASTQAITAAAGRAGGAFAAAFSVRQVKQWADQYTSLQNRLKLVTDGQQELARASDDVYAIAQRSRTGLAEVGDLYFKISQSADRLKISQDDVGRATESFGKLLAISGAGATQASAAILQFSQAVGSGILAGDEFRGVAEAAPAYLDALAESTGFAREELKKLGSEGNLTADILIKALLDQAAKIDDSYGKTSSTIDQSLTRVSNAFVNLTGKLEENSGAFAATADLINAIADALDRIPAAAKLAGDGFDQMGLPGMGGASPVFGAGEAGFELLKGLAGWARERVRPPEPIQTGMSPLPPPLPEDGMSTGGISYGGYTLQQILAMEDANEKLAESMKESAQNADSSARAIQSQIDSLVQQAATLGMTSEQQSIYELRVSGATAAQIAQAEAIARTIALFELEEEAKQDAGDEYQRVRDMGKSYLETLDQLDGGVQAFKNEQEKLNLVLEAGWINQEQYNRLLEEGAKQMDTFVNAARENTLELRESIKDSTSDLFENLLTDSKNWKDHLLGYLRDIGKAFAKLAADNAAQAIFGTTGGSGGGIDWGAMAGKLLGSIFGAAAGGSYGGDIGTSLANTGISFDYSFASGGIMPANKWSLVGEQGPELVMSHNAARVFNNDDTMDMLGRDRAVTVNQIYNVKDYDSFHRNRRQIRDQTRRDIGMG